jgi:hypothetical protein
MSQDNRPASDTHQSDDRYGTLITDRLAALEAVFGEHDDYLVSPLPFYLGGNPTIIGFPHAVPNAKVYCTHEMTGDWGSGQKHGAHGEYEFVIVVPASGPLTPRQHPDKSFDIGPVLSILHGLARFSLTYKFLPGETVGPLDSSLAPMTNVLFVDLTTPKRPFQIDGKTYGLTLAYLITDAEADLKRKIGHVEFTKRLRAAGVYPVSSLDRPNIA